MAKDIVKNVRNVFIDENNKNFVVQYTCKDDVTVREEIHPLNNYIKDLVSLPEKWVGYFQSVINHPVNVGCTMCKIQN